MTTIPSFEDFLAEGGMPSSFPALVREAKRVNDELAALVEQVKQKTQEAESYDRAVAAKLGEMGETTKRVGRILVAVEEKPGRVSYSYKDAERVYYDALMRVNKTAAGVAAKLVESLKHLNPGKTVVSYSVAESVLDRVRAWLSGAWARVVQAFAPYERAVEDLERALGV